MTETSNYLMLMA